MALHYVFAACLSHYSPALILRGRYDGSPGQGRIHHKTFPVKDGTANLSCASSSSIHVMVAPYRMKNRAKCSPSQDSFSLLPSPAGHWETGKGTELFQCHELMCRDPQGAAAARCPLGHQHQLIPPFQPEPIQCFHWHLLGLPEPTHPKPQPGFGPPALHCFAPSPLCALTAPRGSSKVGIPHMLVGNPWAV